MSGKYEFLLIDSHWLKTDTNISAKCFNAHNWLAKIESRPLDYPKKISNKTDVCRQSLDLQLYRGITDGMDYIISLSALKTYCVTVSVLTTL